MEGGGRWAGKHLSLFTSQTMTETTIAALKTLNATIPVTVMVAAADVKDAVELAQHAASVGASAISSGG